MILQKDPLHFREGRFSFRMLRLGFDDARLSQVDKVIPFLNRLNGTNIGKYVRESGGYRIILL
jgi:hypothetical protein